MTKQYKPEDIKKLAPAFAFLSTANPGSLGSIEKAAGYAVPILQSGLEIDPMQSLLLGTALTRAGATSTKSGTWLREMALRAMPGTSLMSKIAFHKHEEALRALGLVDDKDNPTWFTNGKPDIMKMLQIAHEHAAGIPLEKRAAYERQLFGAQGAGAFALLADNAVYDQVKRLGADMNSPEFKARYGGFMQAYNNDVTAQAARTGLQEFNVVMQDIGAHVLPAVNQGLRDLKSLLEALRGALPSSNGWSGATVGARVGEGALIGAGVGAFMGGVGALPGAGIGALTGGVFGVAEQYMAQSAADVAKMAAEAKERANAQQDIFGGAGRAAGTLYGPPKIEVKPLPPPPITFSLNIDGNTLAKSIIDKIGELYRYDTNSPAPDGSQIYGP
jgi:hypothetical protein